MFSDLISVVANVALALSFVVALLFGIAQVRAAARDRRERLTLEALRNFQTREFAELLQFINSHDMPATNKERFALPAEQQVMFIQFAQEMEALGIQVAEGIIDLDMVEKTLGSFVITSWKKYKPIFKEMRDTDPYLGEYFQWLAQRIDQRMREQPRRPFYEPM